MVDDIFVFDTQMYPITPAIHKDSVLESVKFDLNLFGVSMDTRKSKLLIDTNCFDFAPELINNLKQCEDSMLVLFRQKTSHNNKSTNLYNNLLHQLHLQIRRQIKNEPDLSFRFKNDIYKLYLVYLLELRWLQYFFMCGPIWLHIVQFAIVEHSLTR
jgi:hypothetical protein